MKLFGSSPNHKKLRPLNISAVVLLCNLYPLHLRENIKNNQKKVNKLVCNENLHRSDKAVNYPYFI